MPADPTIARIWDSEAQRTRDVQCDSVFEAAHLALLDRIASGLEAIASKLGAP